MKKSSWPDYSESEINAVSKIIKSNKVNYWTGEEGQKFEIEFANFCKTKYAVAVANGTLALELALYSIGICSGDEVIVTSRSYVASVSCIVRFDAKPVFVDVDIDSQNIKCEEIEKNITKKTKAIICVHLAGWPCEMDGIMKIAKKYKIKVVEDCSQAHGATYKNKTVGSIGDIGTFSFCNDKIMSTLGEGGMVITNDKKIWKKVWEYKDHGRNYSLSHKKFKNNKFKWIINSFGSNYRLTEVQSKIGRIQLKKLPKWLIKRKKNAKQIQKLCSKFSSIKKMNIPNYINHSFYRFYIFIEPNKINKNWNRDKILSEINNMGVTCFAGSCPEIYLEKAFDKKTYKPDKRLKNARLLGETSLAFPVHPTMTKKELDGTCHVIEKIFNKITVKK